MEIKHNELAEVSIKLLEHYGFKVETVIDERADGHKFQINTIRSELVPNFRDDITDDCLYGYVLGLQISLMYGSSLEPHFFPKG